GTFDPDGPAIPLPPIDGRFDAVVTQTGPSTSLLSEAFVVPTNISAATLSWTDRIQNFAGVFSDLNQEWSVAILNAAGNTLRHVYSTNPGDPLMQLGPNHRSVDLTSFLQGLAGQTVQLSFQVQDNLFFLNVSLDDVSLLITSPAPLAIPPVTVNNVPPTVAALALNATSINEGDEVTLNGSF